MKVKDLVKYKTYKVFDYKSYTFYSYLYSQRLDDTFVPAFYMGRGSRVHWFKGSDGLIYWFTTDDIHRGDVRECD